MRRLGRLSLAAKLNLSLLAFFLVLAAATTAIIAYGFDRTRDNADARSNEALEQGGSLALQAVAGGAAEQGGLLFEAVAEAGQRASIYVESRALDTGTEPAAAIEFATSQQGHRYDANAERVTDLVVVNGASPEDAAVQDDIAFSSPLDTISPVLLHGFAGEVGGRNLDPIAIVFVSANGVTRHYPPAGIHDLLPANADFSERLILVGPDANPGRRTLWTAPYEDATGRGLIVTARSPVYDGEAFRGLIEVDVSMSNVFAQINGIRPTPGAFAFYVDRDGTLLEGRSFPLLNNEAGTNPELSQVLDAMRSGAQDDPTTIADAKLQLAGEDYYIAYSTVPVLGGTFAVAAPVSDLTAAVTRISAGIEDEGERTLQFMLAAMAVLFAGGLLAAGYLNRRAVVMPISALARAARAVGSGDLEAQVPVTSGGDELSELGVTFNSMVDQLRESERALEERVDQRTRELQTLLDVSQSIASVLDVDRLLNVVLEQSAAVLPNDRSTIMLREGDEFHMKAVRADAGAVDERLQQQIGMRFPISTTPMLWGYLRDGATLRIDDTLGDSPEAAAYRREVVGATGQTMPEFRTWLGIPLIRKGDVIGIMTVARAQPSSYGNEHEAIAVAIAAQVAVAIDNARLFEREAQQSRELSTLLEVALNAAASIELKPLLNLVLNELRGVIPHDRVAIQTYEEGRLTVLAAHDGSAAGATATRGDGHQVEIADDFFSSHFPENMPAIIDDILDDSALARGFRASAHPHINSGLVPHGSYMAIPLTSREHIVGLLTVMRDEPGFYTEDHARLGRAIGSQIAIAIDRARLFEETRRSARETEVLVRADAELFRTLNLDHVLQALVDVAVDVLGVDKSVVMLHEGDVDVIRSYRNFAEDNIASYNKILSTMPHEEPPPETQQPVVYTDVKEAPAFIAEMLAKEGVTSHLSVSIRDTERTLGVFGLSFREHHVFKDEEQGLYSALADRAAVAIKNAELYERAQTAASLEERQRLARELHDSVSQALYGIALGTRTARMRLGDDPHNAAEPVDYVMSLAQAGLAEMRALIFELRPESLEQEGLVAAIEKQVASTEARYKLDVETALGDEPACALEVKEALYRIAQEALHNVVKHAHARHVIVQLEKRDATLILTVRDDGRGFDASASFPGHVGLHSMPERASKLGGTVVVESTAGGGTSVTARVPI